MPPVRSLVAATANPAKLREIAEIIGDAIELTARPHDIADVVESAVDLAGNALLKASAISSATGCAAVADDTGLEVDALDGAPGVRSARFAGDGATDADNVALLLERLDDVEHRTARFHTVVCLVVPGHDPVFAEGRCEGFIATAPRGRSGFGYDPVFVPDDGDGRTFAEMDADEKHTMSHRGRALRALLPELSPGTSP